MSARFSTFSVNGASLSPRLQRLKADVEAVASAAWAFAAVSIVRRQLRTSGLAGVRVPLAMPFDAAGRGVEAVLWRRGSCLETSLVRQEWLRAHGQSVDVVIGVRGPSNFGAHAWLDGQEAHSSEEFVEIRRHRAR